MHLHILEVLTPLTIVAGPERAASHCSELKFTLSKSKFLWIGMYGRILSGIWG